MQRLTEAWFEYDGIRSTEMGLRLVKMPERKSAMRRGEMANAPGRDGYIWIDGGAYEETRIEAECESMDGFDMRAALDWLMRADERWLVFSDEPARAYRARVIGGISAENAMACYDRKRIKVAFMCQPFAYIWPQAGGIVMTEAGFVENPGTAASAPRIAVEASGDFSLVINGELIEITGGSIVVDSEMRDCLSADGASLANERVVLDEFPALNPGPNVISWTGSVSSVTIMPRWRDV